MGCSVDVDPYQVMGLGRNFTLEQLKRRFRDLAMQLHPDRQPAGAPGAAASAAALAVARASYESLLADFAARQAGRQFDELRATARQQDEAAAPRRAAVAQAQAREWGDGTRRKFDNARFNRMFDENRLPDAYQQQGYQDWMKRHDPDANPPPGGAIVHYKEPEPVATGIMGEPFYQLGASTIADFSTSCGAMDYRLAHTTTRLVDDTVVAKEARPQYASVKELEAERSRVSHTPDPAYLARAALAQREAEEAEQRRLAALRRQDDQWRQHFDRVTRMMLPTR